MSVGGPGYPDRMAESEAAAPQVDGADLLDRLAVIEAQPLPSRVAAYGALVAEVRAGLDSVGAAR